MIETRLNGRSFHDGRSREPTVCTAAVLFSDIRGFSRIAERYADDPAGLLEVLNTHLRTVLRAVNICGGLVENFVGDGVMATFGTEGDLSDHVERATAAAIGLIGANEALNRKHAADWGFRLDVGVGIASGTVARGRIGSEEHWELAVIGDPVNVAARLVSLAGLGEILMSGAVYHAVESKLQSELTNQSAVRGRAGSLEIYRMALLGGRGALV